MPAADRVIDGRAGISGAGSMRRLQYDFTHGSVMFGRKPQDSAKQAEERQGFFKRLRARLNRGNSWLTYDLANLFRGRKIDAAILEELESRLLTADVGVDGTEHILSGLNRRVARNELTDVAA